ncbi:hypothetical protein ABW20_dc0106088 [Dactylellina cionopaga]|nr:hypothetical protein ABW20_dc0106088 [Dactylellina cionopaga]
MIEEAPDLSSIFRPPGDPFFLGPDGKVAPTRPLWHQSSSTQIPETSSTQHGSTILSVILQPEYLSPIVARADVISDLSATEFDLSNTGAGFIGGFLEYKISRRLTVKIIPRNPKKDQAAEETVWVFEKVQDEKHQVSYQPATIVVLVPHIPKTVTEPPFYFPDAPAIAVRVSGSDLSIHRLIGEKKNILPRRKDHHGDATPSSDLDSDRTQRMLKKLLEVLKKRFQNPNYTKRVHHDAVISREKYQTVYQDLKARHADRLCHIFASNGYDGKGCREVDKIFEELGIASFCICLWEDMYGSPSIGQSIGPPADGVELGSQKGSFVGFVDLGCGSGVLTDVLMQEGWFGYGLDARRRKTWKSFDENVRCRLVEGLLVPYLIDQGQDSTVNAVSLPGFMPNCVPDDTPQHLKEENPACSSNPFYTVSGSTQIFHSGRFPKGTFLICNHGDELTAWTPLLASLSQSPFIIIPCCSFNLAGRRFRAQNQYLCQGEREESKRSTYQSLINYIEKLCNEVGLIFEREWLRIPSTRNLAIIGRGHGSSRNKASREDLVEKIIRREGGEGWMNMIATLNRL